MDIYKEDKLVIFLLSPKMRIYRHLMLVFLIIIVVLNMGYVSGSANVWGRERFLLIAPSILTFIILFYGNIYWGIPRYLFQNKWGKYGLFLLLLSIVLLAVTIISQYLVLSDFTQLFEEMGWSVFFMVLFASILNVFLFSMGISAIMLFRSWIFSDRQIGSLQATTLQTELDLLKEQINPHFLFNMLNNANVLLKRDTKKAQEVIFKLEELLRYQIEDSNKEVVPLTSDILFLQDFLQLEKVRRDSFVCQITRQGEMKNVRIPPLLFIPFVENAVKYSQDSVDTSCVNLLFRVEEGSLLFLCLNSKPAKEVRKGKTGGLGLKNIRRRLELLYPGTHTLEIEELERCYKVKLEIPL